MLAIEDVRKLADETGQEPGAVTIRYEGGQMVLSPSGLFPLDKARLSKILKLTQLDFNHADSLPGDLVRAARSRQKALGQEEAGQAKRYLDLELQLAQSQPLLRSHGLTRDTKEGLKARIKRLEKEQKEADRRNKAAIAGQKKIEANIEQIRGFITENGLTRAAYIENDMADTKLSE